jgi:hypothetical protein
VDNSSSLKEVPNTFSAVCRPYPATFVQAMKNTSKREKENILYRYMLLRGQLRLGKIVAAEKLCFFTIPLTLGLGLWFWFERAYNEVVYHLDELHVSGSRNKSWLILVPGLHMFLFYRLAKLVLHMESKHQYYGVSPLLTFILSINPLFAAYYLQRALNRHWTLHLLYPSSQEGHYQSR